MTLHDGKKLSLAHQRTDKYVETTTPTAFGGVRIVREAKKDEILIESNNLDGISFVQRKADKNIWYVNMRKKTGTIALLEDFAVITGVITHGGTIPLPAGFKENECKFFVSMRSDNPASKTWDINENHSLLHYRYECKLEGRKVIARTWLGEGGNNYGKWVDGEANYIVIGIKGA